MTSKYTFGFISFFYVYAVNNDIAEKPSVIWVNTITRTYVFWLKTRSFYRLFYDQFSRPFHYSYFLSVHFVCVELSVAAPFSVRIG